MTNVSGVLTMISWQRGEGSATLGRNFVGLAHFTESVSLHRPLYNVVGLQALFAN
jgi:hypothetical protein